MRGISGPHIEMWGIWVDVYMFGGEEKYYHIWFPTKRRIRILMGEIDKEVHKQFSQVAIQKRYELTAFETMIDHAHLLIKLKGDQNLSRAVKMFKGISARRLFQEFPILKEQIRSNNLWAKGFGFKEIPKEKVPVVIKYICDQKKDFEEL